MKRYTIVHMGLRDPTEGQPNLQHDVPVDLHVMPAQGPTYAARAYVRDVKAADLLDGDYLVVFAINAQGKPVGAPLRYNLIAPVLNWNVELEGDEI